MLCGAKRNHPDLLERRDGERDDDGETPQFRLWRVDRLSSFELVSAFR